ncbi:MAG TPA: NTP transferase domain-containing protein [Phycisphaerales bacterium]|nr:NTP transferase domain-containing protein [Phycisphaerales bacterium]
MLTHAVLAAGRGTRMFGPDGGNKAMARVGAGHLIDYVVREVEGLSPDKTIVLAGGDDLATPERVQALTASPVETIRSPSDGTGPGVRRLLAASASTLIALTTCDLAADTGSLTSFFDAALPLVLTNQPRCVVAVSPLDEGDAAPIYVHTHGNHVVDYGKRAPWSRQSFAGARLMNSSFARAMLEIPNPIGTDTEMMSALVHADRCAVLAISVPDLFDVDNLDSLKRATALTREDPV